MSGTVQNWVRQIQDGGRPPSCTITLFKNSRWRWPPSCICFLDISGSSEDIFVKFGTLIDIGHMKVIVAKYQTSDKIQDGGSLE